MGLGNAPGAWVRAAAGLLALAVAPGLAFAGEETSLWRLSPEDIGTYGHEIDSLYEVILWLVTGTFVLTEGALLLFVLKFRARPGGRAVYVHGNHRLEVIWTIIPAAILFWLAVFQMGTWSAIKIDRPAPKEGLVVQVLGTQFEWWFRYAGPDGTFGTEDDVTSLKTLHVPVDTKVTLLLRSNDVLHSFFPPNLRLKQDTVPGLTIGQWFEARKTTAQARAERKAKGDPKADAFHFEIACAELCGQGHTKMQGYLEVHGKDEFWKWLDAAYVKDSREYGTNPDDLINKRWPKTENRIEDVWMRDGWPASLKAAWPAKK
jgi:cytochrome c oxidase subunit 2